MLLGRLVPVLLLPVLVLTPVDPTHAGPDEDRATRVFRRVQEAVHAPQTPHFNSRNVLLTTLVRKTVPEAGRPIHTLQLPPGCGMGVFSGLDVERTVELATALFAIHGFDLQPDLAAAGVRLDGLDPQAKVGFRIQPAALGGARVPVKEGTTKGRKALEAAGYRVLVLPGSRYRCMQADTSSPLHASLLSIVEFLADLAGARPADLSVLARGRPHDVTWSGLEGGIPGADSFQMSDDSAFFVLREPVTVELEVVPPPKVEGRGRPAFVVLPFHWTPPRKNDGSGYDFEGPAPSFALLQDSAPPVESGRAVFLAGPAFDPSKPFRIRIALRAGQTHIGRQVRVRTSSAKRRR